MDDTAVDPFEILGVARAFEVDIAHVRRRQVAMLRESHPDLHATGRDADGARAGAVNQAVAIVSDPARRADALLRLSDGGGKDPSLPPEDLERALALRMELDGADDATRESMARQAREARDDAIAAFAAAWDLDAAAARRARVRWRYWDRLLAAAQGNEGAEGVFGG
ncbi:MAG: hypothetical protein O2819_02270 [Planctomycetota bacterium]|nr:hypothetical protein [Planctomycetota bacterium]MDA1106304.1 hypothetical protein [Planctomycetota bacterium]